MITRRQILAAVAASGLASPLRVLAQLRPEKLPRIGFLFGGSKESVAARLDNMRAGLRDLGYEEGKNITMKYRFADGQYQRQHELAAELVKSGVDVLVTSGTPATRAAQRTTSSIPIVMMGVGDPVESGFVASLSRPGGNITGTTNISPEIGAKRLALLIAVVPKLTRVAVLLNGNNPTRNANFNAALIAAQTAGVQAVRIEVRNKEDFERAFAEMKRQRVNAFMTQTDQFFHQQRAQIIQFAARERLPGIYGDADYAEGGGLMSYGTNVVLLSKRAAVYIDKILKGAKPADLPVEQPTTLELTINRKTADALGIKLSPSILVQATKVIE